MPIKIQVKSTCNEPMVFLNYLKLYFRDGDTYWFDIIVYEKDNVSNAFAIGHLFINSINDNWSINYPKKGVDWSDFSSDEIEDLKCTARSLIEQYNSVLNNSNATKPNE